MTSEYNGGAERDRTVDLLNAIQALSQLSYGPTGSESVAAACKTVNALEREFAAGCQRRHMTS